MIDDPHAVSGTRGLVAPELAHGVDQFPPIALTAEKLPAIRAAGVAFARPPLSPEQQAVTCEDRLIPGPPGAPEIGVLVYTPPDARAGLRPAYLHMHGGGYVLGSAEMSDPGNRALAAALGCVIVSVDYRLAPETRWPGGLEDCYAALRWLHRNAAALGVDPGRIAVGGESAGGGMAAALAILARDRGEIPTCFQYLNAPMLDDRTGSASDPHPFAGEFIWTPASNRFAWGALLGQEAGGADVPEAAVPARVRDLTGLPPAYITIGALDLFVEEDLEYARRLIRAGVPTEFHLLPGAYHGFQIAGLDTPHARQATALARAAFARAFAAAAAVVTEPA